MRKAVLYLGNWNAKDVINLPDMQVDGMVWLPYLRFNKEIERIPILGLRVEGNLDLDGCKKLISLPEGLSVGGYLSLYGCESLTSLPKGLEVGGSLGLWSCTSLISLPEGLKVKGYLNLSGCKLLTSLPEDLEVEGDIRYNSETGFAKIDGWRDDPKIIPAHLRNKLIL